MLEAKKHFILDKSVRSVDESKFSKMSKAIRDTELLLGNATFEPDFTKPFKFKELYLNKSPLV